MTSQVVQIARQLTGRICPVRAQRVNVFKDRKQFVKPWGNTAFQIKPKLNIQEVYPRRVKPRKAWAPVVYSDETKFIDNCFLSPVGTFFRAWRSERAVIKLINWNEDLEAICKQNN